MVIFKSKWIKFEGDLKIKLCGKRLYPNENVKYLGAKVNTNLNLQYHLNDVSIKLNRADALVVKMRKYVNLRYVIFPSFGSYFSCAVLSWLRIAVLFDEL